MAQAMLLNRGAKPANCANLKSARNNVQNKFFGLFLGRFGSLNGLVGLVQTCNNIVGDVESLISI